MICKGVFICLHHESVSLLQTFDVQPTFSSSAEAHRSSAKLKIRMFLSLAPLTMSPFGILETAQTEIAGWTIVCTHSPSCHTLTLLSSPLDTISPVGRTVNAYTNDVCPDRVWTRSPSVVQTLTSPSFEHEAKPIMGIKASPRTASVCPPKVRTALC